MKEGPRISCPSTETDNIYSDVLEFNSEVPEHITNQFHSFDKEVSMDSVTDIVFIYKNKAAVSMLSRTTRIGRRRSIKCPCVRDRFEGIGALSESASKSDWRIHAEISKISAGYKQ